MFPNNWFHFIYPPVRTLLLIGVLFLSSGIFLAAQPMLLSQKISAKPENQTRGCNKSVLLPILPVSTEYEEGDEALSTKGIYRSAPPSHIDTDPDEFKALLGYSGPDFNIEKLDGRVVVLDNTVYTWPSETWHVTGLFRNQSCDNIHITAITARLLGSNGEIIDTVEGRPSIVDLRPGEPAPFEVESVTSRVKVGTIDWHIDYTLSKGTTARSFSFSIYESRAVHGGTLYSLFGSVKNVGEISVSNAHFVVAWLDSKGRILRIVAPQIRLISNPQEVRRAIDLPPRGVQNFFYSTNDPSLVSLIDQKSVAIWGSSN